MIRPALLACIALGILAPAASAQTVDTLDRRLDRLEKEVRAVQRKVFPGADSDFFEPEITPPADSNGGFGVPAVTPSTIVTDRIEALEAQVQSLTGQMEETSFKLRRMEEALARFEGDTKLRLQALEGGGLASGDIAADGAAGGDTALAAYEAAYALYTEQDFAGAQAAFASFLDTNAEHERASNAGYWLGRSLLAQDQPVQAVQAFLNNYQDRREGSRAPDSLLWVGKALMRIDPPRTAQACQAYDRLEREYDGKLSDEVASGVVAARLEADCS
ncbi:outer membrane protein assembly factor BamD [Pacificimonas sp. WHA3]|uniref:Outer membrane protein assembly factor BamD n=1 Tax=Pacificimonas pallii TaxID=2827236 RepID=A0ABS6SGC5_9SPHN|nr:outer membrane protein assembly factor BamD [Pacificimonas pallii]MBV7257473.1 outer membrane protein assembly factor BamD [Pacificimonas pallii]